MIFDKLTRCSRYIGPGSQLEEACAYLQDHDFASVPPGRINLRGDSLYALVQESMSRSTEDGKWEAHRRYIDVHFIVSGQERILYAPVEQLTPGKYDPEKDFLPLSGSGSPLDLQPGFFVVFYPEDAHMPGLSCGSPEKFKKVVIKILLGP